MDPWGPRPGLRSHQEEKDGPVLSCRCHSMVPSCGAQCSAGGVRTPPHGSLRANLSCHRVLARFAGTPPPAPPRSPRLPIHRHLVCKQGPGPLDIGEASVTPLLCISTGTVPRNGILGGKSCGSPGQVYSSSTLPLPSCLNLVCVPSHRQLNLCSCLYPGPPSSLPNSLPHCPAAPNPQRLDPDPSVHVVGRLTLQPSRRNSSRLCFFGPPHQSRKEGKKKRGVWGCHVQTGLYNPDSVARQDATLGTRSALALLCSSQNCQPAP